MQAVACLLLSAPVQCVNYHGRCSRVGTCLLNELVCMTMAGEVHNKLRTLSARGVCWLQGHEGFTEGSLEYLTFEKVLLANAKKVGLHPVSSSSTPVDTLSLQGLMCAIMYDNMPDVTCMSVWLQVSNYDDPDIDRLFEEVSNARQRHPQYRGDRTLLAKKTGCMFGERPMHV